MCFEWMAECPPIYQPADEDQKERCKTRRLTLESGFKNYFNELLGRATL